MTPVMFIDVEIAACDVARDGELIRTHTRDNFYEAMKANWDEARHQREPLQPERYERAAIGGRGVGVRRVGATARGACCEAGEPELEDAAAVDRHLHTHGPSIADRWTPRGGKPCTWVRRGSRSERVGRSP